eukprot:8533450-Ditylum_brightwellii.AAC.1
MRGVFILLSEDISNVEISSYIVDSNKVSQDKLLKAFLQILIWWRPLGNRLKDQLTQALLSLKMGMAYGRRVDLRSRSSMMRETCWSDLTHSSVA